MEVTPTYTVSNGGKTFDIDVSFKALKELTAPASRMYVAILETTTKNNVKSNGETSFEFVMKKMLPATGTLVIGNLKKDTVINFSGSFTFEGNYRLPNNASDPIVHGTEHSVENFENLRVVAWMQNLATKEVYNSGWGYIKDDTTSQYHPKNPYNPLSPNYGDTVEVAANLKEKMELNNKIIVYPNPSFGNVNVLIKDHLTNVDIAVYDQKGANVWNTTERELNANNPLSLDLTESGVYFITVRSDQGFWKEKIVVE